MLVLLDAQRLVRRSFFTLLKLKFESAEIRLRTSSLLLVLLILQFLSDYLFEALLDLGCKKVNPHLRPRTSIPAFVNAPRACGSNSWIGRSCRRGTVLLVCRSL
jgi:hypothetical protein